VGLITFKHISFEMRTFEGDGSEINILGFSLDVKGEEPSQVGKINI